MCQVEECIPSLHVCGFVEKIVYFAEIHNEPFSFLQDIKNIHMNFINQYYIRKISRKIIC